MSFTRLPLVLVALSLSGPALAQSAAPPPQPGVADAAGRVYGDTAYDLRPEWREPAPGAAPAYGYDRPGYDAAAYDRARADWLAECRRNHRGTGKATGAVLGGVLGGVIGNRVAGRGDRTAGTIAGAAVGAVAGGAIGHGSDRARARDWCEAYLERYSGQQAASGPGYGYGYAQPAYGYAYQPMMVMMPVAMPQPAPRRECVETVTTTEYVTTVPVRRTYHRPAPVKRVRIVPDKRVRVN